MLRDPQKAVDLGDLLPFMDLLRYLLDLSAHLNCFEIAHPRPLSPLMASSSTLKPARACPFRSRLPKTLSIKCIAIDSYGVLGPFFIIGELLLGL